MEPLPKITFKKNIAYIFLILAIAIFLGQTLRFPLCSPPIHFDEAFVGIKTLEFLNNTDDHGRWVSFFGKYFPLNIETRHGALEIYLLAPVVAISDLRIEIIRYLPIFFGVLTIIFVFILAKTLFNQAVAAISVIVIATNQYFITTMRWGIVWSFTIQIFSILPILLIFKFYTSKKDLFFYWGMFVLGLGMYARGHYAWFVLGFIMTACLFLRHHFPSNKKRLLIVGCLLFLIGASPALFYYLSDPGFRSFAGKNFPITNGYGIPSHKEIVNNAFFAKNLVLRFKQIFEIIFNISQKTNYRQPYFVLIGLSFICLFYKFFRMRSFSFGQKKTIFIISLFLLILASSCFTLTLLIPGHLLLLMPYLSIIIAIIIFEMFKGSTSLVFKSIGAIFLTTIIFVNFVFPINFSQKCPDSLRFIAGWLTENNITKVISDEYRVRLGIKFYSNLEIDTYPYLENPQSGVAFVMRENKNYDHIDRFLNNIHKTRSKMLTVNAYEVFVIE